MIIYSAKKKDFINDCKANKIADAVKREYEKNIGKANKNEVISWENSLKCMAAVINTEKIDDNAVVCAEYRLPNCGSRIDFIIAGQDQNGKDNVVIVELKQWSTVSIDEDKKLVNTFVGGANRLVAHPSYQAWSYAVTLENYNEAIENENISLFPCAYLHNYTYFEGDDINSLSIFPELDYSPLFFRDGESKLRSFITKYVVKPDKKAIMDRIDNGRIKPSKSLQDVLSNILKGKKEFVLLDDQIVFFQNIMALVKRSNTLREKHVFIIEGGPGTGKSVLAINLLSSALQNNKVAAYVTKNSAPRNAYTSILSSDNRFTKATIKELFLSSGQLLAVKQNTFDALFVDEAHRLNEKSGIYHNQGENQIKEIINASLISVFFIDEMQKITSYDIGSVSNILYWAERFGAEVHQGKLSSQFRCNGSDGYLSFLDDVLDLKKEYYTFDPEDYDIEVVDDPKEMMNKIKKLNLKDNKARMLAGYCWPWLSKKDKSKDDIVIEEKDFSHQWNFSNTNTWAIDENSVDQIGCIHTSQGLEFSYVGVIIGDDLRYENGKVITDYTKRASTDQSLKGLKTLCKKGDIEALKEADFIIRNTYRTLLSRAMKGCFIYCTDKALAKYLKERISDNKRKVNDFYSSLVASTDEIYR